jgi:hypothetical protein
MLRLFHIFYGRALRKELYVLIGHGQGCVPILFSKSSTHISLNEKGSLRLIGIFMFELSINRILYKSSIFGYLQLPNCWVCMREPMFKSKNADISYCRRPWCTSK